MPYGNAGWAEKNRLMEQLIASRPGPPFIYNDVLVLVPSSRMKRMYGRLFLDLVHHQGSSALVPPEIQTLHHFFEKLYSSGSGPRLMDENSRLVLLEGLVKERLINSSLFNQSPDLLAPSLSAALAGMIEQLSAAGVGPEELALKIKDADFSDKPQVKLLVEVYARYASLLVKRGLIDPAGMRAWLRDHFDPAWLGGWSRIVIDGIQDAGKLELDILRKMVDCGNCTYLLDAPSPDLLERAGEFHPLRITKDFVSDVGITPEEESAGMSNDDLFLASALFSDRPYAGILQSAPAPPQFSKTINLLSAVNTREEVSMIAGMVKRSLRNGARPDSILVAFPSLDEYGPLVEEIFNDYGIPYNRALGRQVSASPVSTAMISLLRSCQEDFSGPSLLRIFSSPFTKFNDNPAITPALDRLMRDKRIAGGKDRLFSALTHLPPEDEDRGILSGPLKELFSALEPFAGKTASPLSVWMERFDGLISWSGLAARVEKIHGPLNINLQAFKKLNDTLGSLKRAGILFPEYTYTFNEWLFLLKKTFMHARFQVPPEDEGGVQILGIEESMGLPWKEVYLGGLVDTAFPRRLPQNIFLPEQTLETMGVRTIEKSRLTAAYHFYRLLLSADLVTLTGPENEGDRPMAPSPFLEELTPLKNAGLLNRGIEKTSGIQFSLKIEESHGLPELAKALSLSGNVKGIQDVLNSGIEGLSGIRSALEFDPPGPTLPAIPQQKRVFRVTELDAYINCPYDYYITMVLGIEPLEEVTGDISPMDRGSKVHSILRNFYLSWNTAVTRETRDDALALLRKLADSAFDKEADTFRNRREKELFISVMAERFLDSEEAFWKQGMKPACLEQKIERYRVVLSNGEAIELSAKIDRIDVDENGDFIVVDYKTGAYPSPKMNPEQDIFQLPVYAVMAQQALQDKGPRLKRSIGLAYYDLAGKNKGLARDVVLFNKNIRDDHLMTKPKASPKNAEEYESILKQSMDKARKAVEGILAGDFAAKPRDENKCRYCPNEILCGKKEP
ncbi:MAG: PD-(D/E)XK nuclease family protein [Nitrospirae bacterium]|nr:PD-(D/E)XK nuclease family protein [Nitrospirota bacterium]